MKSPTLILLVILISYIQESQAKATLYRGGRKGKTERSDTLRNEFNFKKKSTAYLIDGKSPDSVLAFYEFYLQENDISRADSLMCVILKLTDIVGYRDKISSISYKYTSNPRTKLLFLSDTGRVKEYRTYFLKSGVSSLKSNRDKQVHYYNLVALDDAYYKVVPDSSVRRQMGHHYNSLAWYSILTQKLDGVEYDLNQSIKYDPESRYPYSNMPLYLLLKGRYKEARILYLKLRDQPFDMLGSTYKDEFFEDFRELAAEGITTNGIKKITRLLNSKSKN